MYCVQCGTQLREGSTFCAQCGFQVAQPPTAIEEPQPTPTRRPVTHSSNAPNDNPAKGFIYAVVFIAISLFLCLVLRGCSGGSESTYQPASSSGTVIGTDVTLMADSGAIGVCVTTADLDEFTKLALANDTTGGQQMINSGRVLVVPSGTKAKIIDIGFTAYRVRILSGSYAGRDGWVVREATK